MEVVRQQTNDKLVKLLIKIREGDLDEEEDKALLLKFVVKGHQTIRNEL